MDRLRVKLARVVVPAHVRKVDGKLVRVDAYTYDRQGHALDAEYEQRTFGGGVHPPLQGTDYAAAHRSEIEGRMLSPGESSFPYKHIVKDFQRMTKAEQAKHLRDDHGAQVDEATVARRAGGWMPESESLYQRHVTAHADDQGRMASPAEPVLKQPVVRAHLVFGEVEHEGDLERYLQGGPINLYDPETRTVTERQDEGLAAKARRHGIRVVSMEALADVDEDSGHTEGGDYPHDDYYEGGGRYEEGVIVFEGPKDKMKAFLAETGHGGASKLEWVGKPPPRRFKMTPTPGFKPDWSKDSAPVESQDVYEGGHPIAKVQRYAATTSFPGSSYGPKPSRWIIKWEWAAHFTGQYQGQHPTAEAALAEIKRVYKPPVRL